MLFAYTGLDLNLRGFRKNENKFRNGKNSLNRISIAENNSEKKLEVQIKSLKKENIKLWLSAKASETDKKFEQLDKQIKDVQEKFNAVDAAEYTVSKGDAS